MTDTDALAAFVTARLDEDERTARAADSRRWEWSAVGAHGYPQQVIAQGNAALVAECYESPDHPSTHAEHITRQDPVATLRRVEAHRSILARYEAAVKAVREHAERVQHAPTGPTFADALATTQRWRDLAHDRRPAVAAIAAVWHDHPDYRQEFRP